MLLVLVQMAGLIVCGIAWRLLRPGGLDPVQTRKVLTALVYYLLLPALVVSVLWNAELGRATLMIASSGAAAVVLGWLLGLFLCRLCASRPNVAGAMILAAAFPNVTYLGLPVLDATFGHWARGVAVQIDLFACTPLLFTLGVLIATRFGTPASGPQGPLAQLLRIPALWAAVAASALNLSGAAMPAALEGLLGRLESGVVPLMLISLGLSLEWSGAQWKRLPMVIPVAVLRLLVVPAAIALLTTAIGLQGETRSAVVLETAMPSMVIGIVFCDRFNLDTALYAAAVTLTTLLSAVTLPLWYRWL